MSAVQPRMKSPAVFFPDTFRILLSLVESIHRDHVPLVTLRLAELRASQINGCGFCVDMHARELRELGETDERLFAVAAWREAPYFSDAERAALALAECATRLADTAEAVPDEVWLEAARYFDEPALATLVLNIAMINFWNRINVATRQPAGSYRPQEARLCPKIQ